MKDVLITSSVLILVLLALRQVFRKTISRRVQYALWGLVLVRLLVPVSLPALDFNVLTASEPAVETVSHHLEQRTVYVLPTGQVDLPEESRRNPDIQPGYAMPPTSTGIMVVDEGGETATVYAGWLTTGELLRCVWYAGIAVMACWFLVGNLRFWRKLRQARTPCPVDGCKYPVYLVESGLPSPCLFGLFRPAIYLTPAAVSSRSACGTSSPTRPPTPGIWTPCGRRSGACAWRCTGSTRWRGRQPSSAKRTVSWPATKAP